MRFTQGCPPNVNLLVILCRVDRNPWMRSCTKGVLIFTAEKKKTNVIVNILTYYVFRKGLGNSHLLVNFYPFSILTVLKFILNPECRYPLSTILRDLSPLKFHLPGVNITEVVGIHTFQQKWLTGLRRSALARDDGWLFGSRSEGSGQYYMGQSVLTWPQWQRGVFTKQIYKLVSSPRNISFVLQARIRRLYSKHRTVTTRTILNLTAI